MTLARAIIQTIVRLVQTSPFSSPSFDGYSRSSSPPNQFPFQSAYVAAQSSRRFNSTTETLESDLRFTNSAIQATDAASLDGNQSSLSLSSSELLLPWTHEAEARLSELSVDTTSTPREASTPSWYTSLMGSHVQGRSLFNGLSIFDASVASHYDRTNEVVGGVPGDVAALWHSSDSNPEGILLPMSDQLTDALESVVAASQDEHRAVIVNYEHDGRTNASGRVHQLDQATQALRNFFMGRPIVVPFGNSRIYLNPGITSSVSPAFHRSVSNSYGSAYSVFDRIITQLMNQVDSGPPPASQADIEEIPFVDINADHLVNTSCCAICIEDYVLSEPARQLICGHFFHSACIVRWLQMHGTCPVCRSRLTGFVRQPPGNQLSTMTQIMSSQLPNRENEDWVSVLLDDVTDAFLSSNSSTIVSDSGSLSSQWFTSEHSDEEVAVVDLASLQASRGPTPLPLDNQEPNLDSCPQPLTVASSRLSEAQVPSLNSGRHLYTVPASASQLPGLDFGGSAVIVGVVDVEEAGITSDGGLHLHLFA